MVCMYVRAMDLRCAMANEQPTVQGVNGGGKQPCSLSPPEAKAAARRLKNLPRIRRSVVRRHSALCLSCKDITAYKIVSC